MTASPLAGVTVCDDTAAIGRLYRRQDEVGTPYCVTVDVQTVGDPVKGEAGDGRVTIRNRDSMGQVRVPVPGADRVFAELLGECRAAVAARYPAHMPPWLRMSHPFKPIDAFKSPRFSQIATFMRLPHHRSAAELDVAPPRHPLRRRTSYRAGARFARARSGPSRR